MNYMWFLMNFVVCCWKNGSIILSKTTGPYSHRKQPFVSAIVNHNLRSFIITRNRNQLDNWKAKLSVETSVKYNGSCPLRFLLRLLNNYESVWWKWKWKTPIWCSLAWLCFPRHQSPPNTQWQFSSMENHKTVHFFCRVKFLRERCSAKALI